MGTGGGKLRTITLASLLFNNKRNLVFNKRNLVGTEFAVEGLGFLPPLCSPTKATNCHTWMAYSCGKVKVARIVLAEPTAPWEWTEHQVWTQSTVGWSWLGEDRAKVTEGGSRNAGTGSSPHYPIPQPSHKQEGREDAEMHAIQQDHPHCKQTIGNQRSRCTPLLPGQSLPGRCSPARCRCLQTQPAIPHHLVQPGVVGAVHSPSIVMLGSSLRGNLGCLFLRARSLWFWRSCAFPTLISHRSGLCTLPRDHVIFLRLGAGCLFCSPVELLAPPPPLWLILPAKWAPGQRAQDRSRETQLPKRAPEQTKDLATAEMRHDSSPSPGMQGASTVKGRGIRITESGKPCCPVQTAQGTLRNTCNIRQLRLQRLWWVGWVDNATSTLQVIRQKPRTSHLSHGQIQDDSPYLQTPYPVPHWPF